MKKFLLNKNIKVVSSVQLVSNLHDFRQLVLVFKTVFEMKDLSLPGDDHLECMLRNENFFAVVAKMDNIIVGGLTVYVLDQYYTKKPIAYLYDLAVLTKHQRKGVGRSLIDFTREFCRQRGYAELFVQAEKADDYAIDFYRITNPSGEMQVVHFSYLLSIDKL